MNVRTIPSACRWLRCVECAYARTDAQERGRAGWRQTEELPTKAKFEFFLLEPGKLFFPALSVSFEILSQILFLLSFTSLVSSAAFSVGTLFFFR